MFYFPVCSGEHTYRHGSAWHNSSTYTYSGVTVNSDVIAAVIIVTLTIGSCLILLAGYLIPLMQGC